MEMNVSFESRPSSARQECADETKDAPGSSRCVEKLSSNQSLSVMMQQQAVYRESDKMLETNTAELAIDKQASIVSENPNS